MDIWNLATRAHVITLTVPGGANEEIESVGPAASELLSTGSLNVSTEPSSKLDVWSIQGSKFGWLGPIPAGLTGAGSLADSGGVPPAETAPSGT